MQTGVCVFTAISQEVYRSHVISPNCGVGRTQKDFALINDTLFPIGNIVNDMN
jgi:hypothetical protein